VQLSPENRCQLFGLPERPTVCQALRPEPQMCGPDRAHALTYLNLLESETAPHH
jgi:uncharacterized protein